MEHSRKKRRGVVLISEAAKRNQRLLETVSLGGYRYTSRIESSSRFYRPRYDKTHSPSATISARPKSLYDYSSCEVGRYSKNSEQYSQGPLDTIDGYTDSQNRELVIFDIDKIGLGLRFPRNGKESQSCIGEGNRKRSKHERLSCVLPDTSDYYSSSYSFDDKKDQKRRWDIDENWEKDTYRDYSIRDRRYSNRNLRDQLSRSAVFHVTGDEIETEFRESPYIQAQNTLEIKGPEGGNLQGYNGNGYRQSQKSDFDYRKVTGKQSSSQEYLEQKDDRPVLREENYMGADAKSNGILESRSCYTKNKSELKNDYRGALKGLSKEDVKDKKSINGYKQTKETYQSEMLQINCCSEYQDAGTVRKERLNLELRDSDRSVEKPTVYSSTMFGKTVGEVQSECGFPGSEIGNRCLNREADWCEEREAKKGVKNESVDVREKEVSDHGCVINNTVDFGDRALRRSLKDSGLEDMKSVIKDSQVFVMEKENIIPQENKFLLGAEMNGDIFKAKLSEMEVLCRENEDKNVKKSEDGKTNVLDRLEMDTKSLQSNVFKKEEERCASRNISTSPDKDLELNLTKIVSEEQDDLDFQYQLDSIIEELKFELDEVERKKLGSSDIVDIVDTIEEGKEEIQQYPHTSDDKNKGKANAASKDLLVQRFSLEPIKEYNSSQDRDPIISKIEENSDVKQRNLEETEQEASISYNENIEKCTFEKVQQFEVYEATSFQETCAQSNDDIAKFQTDRAANCEGQSLVREIGDTGNLSEASGKKSNVNLNDSSSLYLFGHENREIDLVADTKALEPLRELLSESDSCMEVSKADEGKRKPAFEEVMKGPSVDTCESSSEKRWRRRASKLMFTSSEEEETDVADENKNGEVSAEVKRGSKQVIFGHDDTETAVKGIQHSDGAESMMACHEESGKDGVSKDILSDCFQLKSQRDNEYQKYSDTDVKEKEGMTAEIESVINTKDIETSVKVRMREHKVGESSFKREPDYRRWSWRRRKSLSLSQDDSLRSSMSLDENSGSGQTNSSIDDNSLPIIDPEKSSYNEGFSIEEIKASLKEETDLSKCITENQYLKTKDLEHRTIEVDEGKIEVTEAEGGSVLLGSSLKEAKKNHFLTGLEGRLCYIQNFQHEVEGKKGDSFDTTISTATKRTKEIDDSEVIHLEECRKLKTEDTKMLFADKGEDHVGHTEEFESNSSILSLRGKDDIKSKSSEMPSTKEYRRESRLLLSDEKAEKDQEIENKKKNGIVLSASAEKDSTENDSSEVSSLREYRKSWRRQSGLLDDDERAETGSETKSDQRNSFKSPASAEIESTENDSSEVSSLQDYRRSKRRQSKLLDDDERTETGSGTESDLKNSFKSPASAELESTENDSYEVSSLQEYRRSKRRESKLLDDDERAETGSETESDQKNSLKLSVSAEKDSTENDSSEVSSLQEYRRSKRRESKLLDDDERAETGSEIESDQKDSFKLSVYAEKDIIENESSEASSLQDYRRARRRESKLLDDDERAETGSETESDQKNSFKLSVSAEKDSTGNDSSEVSSLQDYRRSKRRQSKLLDDDERAETGSETESDQKNSFKLSVSAEKDSTENDSSEVSSLQDYRRARRRESKLLDDDERAETGSETESDQKNSFKLSVSAEKDSTGNDSSEVSSLQDYRRARRRESKLLDDDERAETGSETESDQKNSFKLSVSVEKDSTGNDSSEVSSLQEYRRSKRRQSKLLDDDERAETGSETESDQKNSFKLSVSAEKDSTGNDSSEVSSLQDYRRARRRESKLLDDDERAETGSETESDQKNSFKLSVSAKKDIIENESSEASSLQDYRRARRRESKLLDDDERAETGSETESDQKNSLKLSVSAEKDSTGNDSSEVSSLQEYRKSKRRDSKLLDDDESEKKVSGTESDQKNSYELSASAKKDIIENDSSEVSSLQEYRRSKRRESKLLDDDERAETGSVTESDQKNSFKLSVYAEKDIIENEISEVSSLKDYRRARRRESKLLDDDERAETGSETESDQKNSFKLSVSAEKDSTGNDSSEVSSLQDYRRSRRRESKLLDDDERAETGSETEGDQKNSFKLSVSAEKDSTENDSSEVSSLQDYRRSRRRESKLLDDDERAETGSETGSDLKNSFKLPPSAKKDVIENESSEVSSFQENERSRTRKSKLLLDNENEGKSDVVETVQGKGVILDWKEEYRNETVSSEAASVKDYRSSKRRELQLTLDEEGEERADISEASKNVTHKNREHRRLSKLSKVDENRDTLDPTFVEDTSNDKIGFEVEYLGESDSPKKNMNEISKEERSEDIERESKTLKEYREKKKRGSSYYEIDVDSENKIDRDCMLENKHKKTDNSSFENGHNDTVAAAACGGKQDDEDPFEIKDVIINYVPTDGYSNSMWKLDTVLESPIEYEAAGRLSKQPNNRSSDFDEVELKMRKAKERVRSLLNKNSAIEERIEFGGRDEDYCEDQQWEYFRQHNKLIQLAVSKLWQKEGFDPSRLVKDDKYDQYYNYQWTKR
ncbi:uncharacterized protein LOC135680779 isoform X1 [Rhopilema esculentum]|uniref:uncharacterized protein LOC135680779 isoform X1 n=1 Tax=Rhopilema esculentum TaxID=499914 RepID=UPI0031D581DB